MIPIRHNQLHWGDNLVVLRERIPRESIDLVYLDPPFKSQASYNLLFKERNGERSAAQVAAFADTWTWGREAKSAYDEVVENGPHGVSRLVRAFHDFLKSSDMMAYVAMMAPRLVLLHQCLKTTGSLYLHCDPTASHYLKLLLDALFGPGNFRNEIIWRRTGAHNSARRYGPVHDVILFYTKSKDYTWNPVLRPYVKGYVDDYFNKKDGERRYRSQTLTGSGTRGGACGQPWRGYDPTAKGRHWAFPGALADELGLEADAPLHAKLDALAERGLLAPAEVAGLPEYRQYLDTSKGVLLQDVWAYQPYTNGCLAGSSQAIDEDVKWLAKRGRGSERLEYPTQKPLGLLQRIIRASSNEGDVVLDPFCGCGTCIVMAESLARRWIGIDITHLAIGHVRRRLQEAIGPTMAPIEFHGIPSDAESARALAREDKHKFQIWALWAVGARPARDGKGPDRGVDGYIYFRDSADARRYGVIIVQVKGGANVGARDVRELIGTLSNEHADIAVLVTLGPPTAQMQVAAAEAGFYVSTFFAGRKYARVQIITVGDFFTQGLFTKRYPLHPEIERDATHKHAAPLDQPEEQAGLF